MGMSQGVGYEQEEGGIWNDALVSNLNNLAH